MKALSCLLSAMLVVAGTLAASAAADRRGSVPFHADSGSESRVLDARQGRHGDRFEHHWNADRPLRSQRHLGNPDHLTYDHRYLYRYDHLRRFDLHSHRHGGFHDRTFRLPSRHFFGDPYYASPPRFKKYPPDYDINAPYYIDRPMLKNCFRTATFLVCY